MSYISNRMSNVYNLTGKTNGNYLPITYNDDRLIHNANNIVLANGQTNFLMPKEETRIYYGRYGKNSQIS